MGKTILDKTMMLRLPLATTGFSVIRNSKIYVDKTSLIMDLALNNGAPVFLSRPRRFGKSLLVSTFESLFSRGLQDFKGLAIETGKEKWTDRTYKVVHLDFSKYAFSNAENFSRKLTAAMLFSLYGKSGATLSENEKSQDPEEVLSEFAATSEDKTGQKCGASY